MSYPIPAEALDDRHAWVGTAGAGKTYNAGSGVEQLLAAKSRVGIFDPLDVWWGLRLDPDGKGQSRFRPVIFGGPHGDLPLNEHSGALLGEACATMRESFIISLADLKSKAAERRFMLAFLQALERHANREPVHLVFDEADLWAPQAVLDRDGEAMKLLGMMEQIVRRGRIKGFIPWLITQRPAVLSKNVLSQADGLIAFKLTSSQDRDAIGSWIEGQADKAVGKEILASLPTMQMGQGVVWIPGRGILKTAQFPLKATFDSSRTPKRGEVVRTTALKPLDLGALKDRLAAVEEEAKANDPKALKAEIARLRAGVAKAPTVNPRAFQDADQQGYERGLADGEERGFLRGVEEGEKRGNVAGQALALTRVRLALDGVKVDKAPTPSAPPARAIPAKRQPDRETSTAPAFVNRVPPQAPVGDGSVPTGCAKPLAALAAVYPSGLTDPQWATAAGYKRSGGTWGTYKSRLKGAGLIEQREGRWFATAAGAEACGDVEMPPPPGPDLVRWWAAKLPGTPKIVEALIDAWPRELDRDELAAAVEMSASGGSFGTYLSRLAGPGIIERSGRTVRLSADAMGAA